MNGNSLSEALEKLKVDAVQQQQENHHHQQQQRKNEVDQMEEIKEIKLDLAEGGG